MIVPDRCREPSLSHLPRVVCLFAWRSSGEVAVQSRVLLFFSVVRLLSKSAVVTRVASCSVFCLCSLSALYRNQSVYV